MTIISVHWNTPNSHCGVTSAGNGRFFGESAPKLSSPETITVKTTAAFEAESQNACSSATAK